ncbi:helicase-related protein [Opitutales bacterium]|nr:helicase-related protein [Opitutales bacterium]
MGFLNDFLDSILEIFDPSTGKKGKKKKQKKQKVKSKRKQKTSKSQKSSKTSAPKSAEASLEEKIIRLLADGEKSASELSGLLRVDKSSINRILYQNIDNLFTKHGETPPYWSLTEGIIPDNVEATDFEEIPFELYDWQKKAAKAWFEAGGTGVVEAVTGTGKTRLGAFALGKVINEGGKGVVLVPTRELQDQWVAELENLGFSDIGRMGNGRKNSLRNCRVLVAVAASACKYDLGLPQGTKGILVADEVHRYASETWQEALESAFDSRLGLTATFERQDGTHEDILLPYFKNIAFSYNYSQAIKKGIIAEFKLATIGVSFSKQEREYYEKCSEEVSKAVRHLKNHHGAPDPYAGGKSFGEFMKFITQLSKGGDMREGIAAGRFLKHFTERKRLLAETYAKYEALKKLSSSIKASNGTIAFTATIESAEIAAEVLEEKKISCGLHHSKMNKENRRLVLKQFKGRALDAIIAPKTLDEGIDIPEADLGIIIAASRERRQMIQRMGRVLRRKKDQRLAKFAILYVKDTSEDPKNGAHGAFLETILPVASEHKDFGPRASAKSISDFLK